MNPIEYWFGGALVSFAGCVVMFVFVRTLLARRVVAKEQVFK